MADFAWLHLSDLHQGLGPARWLWPTISREFFDDLARLHDRCGPWDVAFFTGDLAQTGDKDEYSRLDETLANIWTQLERLGSKPVLLAVPGNHDLKRPSKKTAVHRLLCDIAGNAEVAAELWDEADSEYRSSARALFRDYSEWWSRHSQNIPAEWEYQDGLLPGDFSVRIPKGATIGVAGLNSSLAQLDASNFRGRLAVDVRQLHSVCQPDAATWAHENTCSFLLTHHPVDWLQSEYAEQYLAEIYPEGRFIAHLHGHLHEPSQTAMSSGGSLPRRHWCGTSLFGLEQTAEGVERLHGFSAGRLQLAGANSSLRAWHRSAEKTSGGSWFLGVNRRFRTESDEGTAAERVELRDDTEVADVATEPDLHLRSREDMLAELRAWLSTRSLPATLAEISGGAALSLCLQTVAGTHRELEREILRLVERVACEDEDLTTIHLELLVGGRNPAAQSIWDAWGRSLGAEFRPRDAALFARREIDARTMWSRMTFSTFATRGVSWPQKVRAKFDFTDE